MQPTEYVRMLPAGTKVLAIDDDNIEVAGMIEPCDDRSWYGHFRVRQEKYPQTDEYNHTIEYYVRWDDGEKGWFTWAEIAQLDTEAPSIEYLQRKRSERESKFKPTSRVRSAIV